MLPQAKLYVLVRNDILPGYQLAQSCHAAFRFAAEHPEITQKWMDVSEYICCLSVSDEAELKAYKEAAEFIGIHVAEFHEPDLNDELTAVALAPYEVTRELCSTLSLALRGSYDASCAALGGR